MTIEASFGLDAVTIYVEKKRKPRDLRRLQGAMFTDRTDLWPERPARRRRAPLPPPSQLALPTPEVPPNAGS